MPVLRTPLTRRECEVLDPLAAGQRGEDREEARRQSARQAGRAVPHRLGGRFPANRAARRNRDGRR